MILYLKYNIGVSWTPSSSSVTPSHPTRSQICNLGQHFTDINGSKYMLVHSLASKYARFVVLGRLMYLTPPPDQTIEPPPF